MAKLKCIAHSRRVMILQVTGQWIHRDDDSKCDSLNAKIGEQQIVRGKEFEVDPAQQLLYDIFVSQQ